MSAPTTASHRPTEAALEAVSIRFCGDSGDGMQLTGGQFTNTSALFGNDIATFPDFPAEIRAPRGTTYGVSAFQVQFASSEIYTPGDAVNALVAMNPAGLKTNIRDVEPGGIVIVNDDEFNAVNFKKCGYPDGVNPLDDEDFNRRYRVYRVPMSRLTRESLAEAGMGAKDVDRCRNMYALGLVYWLYERPIDATVRFLEEQFEQKRKRPELADLNIRALKAGYNFGETAEMFPVRFKVPPAKLAPGVYRKISGNEATALGFVVAAHKAGKRLTYASYPITPASDVLHTLASLKRFGVQTFQAEDEIAAVCAAIGAAYAGDFALTGSSGPGIALKGEAIGLAVMLELPIVIINVQRAGPATGMPTKTEQADLLQAMYGRASESPVAIVAPRSPADCFTMAIEAFRLAVRCMCPVIFLSDGYIANGAEPWLMPDLDAIEPITAVHPTANNNPEGNFLPYERNPSTLGRPWAIPGTPGLEHRVGGLEKQDGTGNVSYDPENHDHMVRTRAEKIQRAVEIVPPLEVRGPESGDALLLGWGGTYGAITTAGDRLRASGHKVSTAHLRYLNPMPANVEEVLRRFRRVIVPEINLGQLRRLIRDRFLIDAVGINEVRGTMFRVETLVERTLEIMGQKPASGAAGMEGA
ncbi:MAG: 2-oxoacid:acceptor oxidoreductase subunit alpha [Phycisphaerales bacterium]|nr:2-oxoacid:acceptor oxidoreductase subunit alpha [Phycisphaerales bacterium]